MSNGITNAGETPASPSGPESVESLTQEEALQCLKIWWSGYCVVLERKLTAWRHPRYVADTIEWLAAVYMSGDFDATYKHWRAPTLGGILDQARAHREALIGAEEVDPADPCGTRTDPNAP